MTGNTEKIIKKYIEGVGRADADAKIRAREYDDALIKPPRSLGKLEDIAVKLAGITGHVKNRIGCKKILVFCADNGVTAEGVASAPVSVTASQAVNMTSGITGMSALAKNFGAEVVVVDVGVATEFPLTFDGKKAPIIDKKIRKGTGNIVCEPAMSMDECLCAILTGIEIAVGNDDGAEPGYIDLVGIGEMGIGNTTTSAAVLSAITGVCSDGLTGRGAGISDEAYDNKKKVINKALSLHGLTDAVDKYVDDFGAVTDILSKVGGLDIAAMCGAFIGAAYSGKGAVIDGYISAVAALLAVKLCPAVSDYLFPSHVSTEPGYMLAIKELGLRPYLDLNMGLGEGSGCVLAFGVIEGACAMMNDMATFEGGGIDDSYLEGIR
ncbi:nicotinate-nucleotide--dimethylbenzimidazole phosphoribosyltransferase [Butyrivibrio sp. AE3003]|uniref:nicotinate-nucleotide--dimethylbenzimidazole phosphoribosyltransferase n=1 Tax=Butyrivibrio sp. AE3003 TaxID=1496721 RepID=UPI000557376C|nr:nicotinate-nucleotide--dimethylbenzimidazole phosphoribosyltransferase [Butyrivibrio sp. AE3003]